VISDIVLAIDPGTRKCGIAVVRREGTEVLHREIVTPERLAESVRLLTERYRVETVLLGNATNSAPLRRSLQEALPESLSLLSVPEAYTTQRAKVRYLQENPPRSFFARLLPLGLRTPDRPFDDYVAILLAEDYFSG